MTPAARRTAPFRTAPFRTARVRAARHRRGPHRALLLCACLAGAACAAPPSDVGVGASVDDAGTTTGAVGVAGPSGAVGVSSSGGVAARVDVVDTGNARISVGASTGRWGGGRSRWGGFGRGGGASIWFGL